MKHCNVKFTAIAKYSDGHISSCRWFCTDKAMCNWVNAQLHKYKGVSVTVWEGTSDRVYCTCRG